MAALDNSTRRIAKATHSPLALPTGRASELSRAQDKAAMLRALQLRPGEVDAVREQHQGGRIDQVGDGVWAALRGFEPQPVGALLPTAADAADLPAAELVAAGRAVLAYRTRDLDEGTAETKTLVTYADSAVRTFVDAVRATPIGMLHLERIEMTPAGIERGELIATIPLAPGESTSVVQKEWSVTDEEFSSIVTDELEEYSEKGVTEKTELAQATSAQNRHSQQLGLDTSVSGSYGMVTFTAAAKYGATADFEESVKASRTHAAEVTGKASARVRKERKVTITATTETGQQETTTRTLTNPSTTDAMRIDYYSMMRRWRVRLLQYGLRLTYDIAIPEPAATLRGAFARLAAIDTEIARPFVFGLRPDDINPGNYQQKAADAKVALPTPPHAEEIQTFGGPVASVAGDEDDEGWHFTKHEFDVKDGYQITGITVDGMLGVTPDHGRTFVIVGCFPPPWAENNSPAGYVNHGLGTFLVGRTGRQSIVFMLQAVNVASVSFTVRTAPRDETLAAWRFAAWQALHDAGKERHYAHVRELVAEREVLAARLTGVDTLTLRQEEREEVMKGVLRWLLGPAFDFMPADVRALFGGATGAAFTTNELKLTSSGWATMFRYQEMVKFLQEAVEWENLLYFCYPYFWDVPAAWEFARNLRHDDATRQRFLRAGSARVVLTIRPGYEDAFAAFVDRGDFGKVLPAGHPYLTIGQAIRAYDQANYPGIPPANVEGDARPQLSPAQRRAWQEIQDIVGRLEAYRSANGGYPSTLDVLDGVAAADPWGNPYVYAHPGVRNEYELSSLGADGTPGADDITSWAPASLVAEWYEYTPSHGTDIAVDTATADMA